MLKKRNGKKNPTARGPLRATKFFCTELIAVSGIVVFPSLRIGVTSTDSHSIGVCANISRLRHKAMEMPQKFPSKNAGGAEYFESRAEGSGGMIPVRTLAAEKMSLTLLEISGPIPSPSMNVTV